MGFILNTFLVILQCYCVVVFVYLFMFVISGILGILCSRLLLCKNEENKSHKTIITVLNKQKFLWA
jgi:hypothetical protein